MKHKNVLSVVACLLLSSTTLLAIARGNPANGQTVQAQVLPERRVGNTTPGALFSALEKIVDRVIALYVPDFEKLPAIALEEITRAEFERYRDAYQPRIDPGLSRVQHTETTFTIPTAKARLVFNRGWENRIYEGQDGYSYAEYGGYYADLGLYAVKVSGSEAIEWGEALLIDPQTSIVYVLPTIGDGPSGAALASPGSTWLAWYDNQVVGSAESFIALIRIGGSPRQYRAYAGLLSRGRLVESLVWIDDHAFAVKYRIGKAGDDFQYFRTKDLRDLGK